MTTVVCDVTETGAAVSSVRLGFTDWVDGVGSGVSKVLLGIVTALFSAGVATSFVDSTKGLELTSEGVVVTTAPTQLRALQLVVEQGEATSAADAVRIESVVSQGAVTSSVALTRSASVLSTSTAVTPVSVSGRLTNVVLDAVTAKSIVYAPVGADALSTGVGTSAVSLARTATASLLSTGAGASTAVVDTGKGVTALSSGAATDTAVSALTATTTVLEAAAATSSALYPQQNGAWVMNTENTAMSRWVGLPVGSAAVVGGLVLGLGSTGLYKLEGTEDDTAQINASVLTGKSALGVEALKALSDLVISYVCAGVMQVKISTFGEKNATYTYALEKRSADAPRASRLTPGKGLRSRYYQFEFTSAAGASFDVDTVKVDVAAHTRRV